MTRTTTDIPTRSTPLAGPRRLRRAWCAAVATALALTACSTPATTGTTPGGPASSDPAATREVTVFAAASLTAAFTEIGELDPSLDVTFSFDGSPTLVEQLAAGAPADVLATADEANMTKAADGDLIAPDPAIFATNTAVLIVPAGNPAGVTGLDASLDGAKLVLCAPTVPCGATARRIADAAGVTLAPVSEEQKVTDVRGKVASGEADAGIVFATDASAAGDAVETIDLPGARDAATRYPIAVTTDAPDPDAARAFIDLVTGPRGQEVLARYGFTAP